jgi:uncharacterized protein (DUF2236 family)
MAETGHADLGYFGPGSVTWRIHREPLMMIGGLRALLMQALHPEAMRLLYQRSNFQDDPWARLQSTVRYVVTVSFGTAAEADAAAAHVRRVHEQLGVVDPGQLAWVHACEVDSFLCAARSGGLGLSASDADRYVDEQAVGAGLVGVPDILVPRSFDELQAYLAGMRPHLALTAEAREGARAVLTPPLPVPSRYTVPARLAWTSAAALATALLPGWARRMYRLPPLPGVGVVAAGCLRTLRTASLLLPPEWREGPAYRAALARGEA